MMGDPGATRIWRMTQRDLISTAQRPRPLFATISEAERTARFNDILQDADLSPRVSRR